MILMDLKGRIQFFKTEALPSALRRSVPKSFDMVIGHIVYFIAVGVKDDQERHAALLFKLSHKADLVLMDILQAKRIAISFLGVKAHRNALNRSDVIHRTLLVKISQCDMPVLFINFDGRDRRRHLLYQRQAFLQVLLVGSVDEVLQGGAPKASGIPGCHSIIRLRFLFIVYIPQLSFLMFYQYS